MAQTPRQQPPSFEFSSRESSLCIPAEIVAGGLVLMQAEVNGHAGWFILDNASQGFTIDTEYARRNSLEFTDRARASGGGAGPIDAGIVHDVRISLKGLVLIVFYSMATSTAEDAPRGMEFLYSLNRLNVAISRAQCVAAIVASPGLFQVQCKTPRQIELANAFCRYLELAKPS